VSVRRLYEFGPYRLDAERRLLSRQGQVVPLTPKVLDTLLVLVENRGHVVGKEELMKAVWPDTFVEEGNLTQNISTLRKVLGESSTEHMYIKTVPKQGYRFIAQVMEREGESWLSRRSRWVAGALAGVVAAAVVAGWILRQERDSPAPPLTATPLTSYQGLELHPSFSPDGNQVAFAWNGEKRDNLDIHVKLVGSDGLRRLTQDPARDFRPAWSPDGRFIAFLREEPGGNAGVIVVPAIGGLERKVAVVYPGPFGRYARRPCLEWTADSLSLFTTDRDSPEQPSALVAISIDSGRKRRLTSPPETYSGDLAASLSPDGRTLAFSRAESGNFGALCLLRVSRSGVAEGEPNCFSTADMPFDGIRALRWLPGGRDILFSSPFLDAGPTGLWRMAAPGPAGLDRNAQRLPLPSDNCNDPDVSRDGRRLAYSGAIMNSDIWRLELSGASARRPGRLPQERLISSTWRDGNGQYSPNGEKIAFISSRSGYLAVWVANGDGSGATQLTRLDAPLTGWPRWSPDGTRIVFDSIASGQFDIYVINADGGGLRRLTKNGGNSGTPSWSRDGQWIYFAHRRSGSRQIFKMPAAGGEAIQLTKGGGSAPMEAPDGKFVYYTKSLSGATSIWRIPTAGGEETEVVGPAWPLHFTVGRSGVYFVAPDGSSSSIRFFSFETGEVTTVTPVDGSAQTGLSLSPDGRYLLYSFSELANSDLMLVENFR
jgi:Tol biopolymer transport system component/DNA-binding winged helix-turn-helix (wHTH) protein